MKKLVAAVVSVLLCAGCGGKSGTSQASISPAPAGAQASQGDVAVYDAVVSGLFGTPQQRLEGDELVNLQLNQATRRCLAQVGVMYTPRAHRGVAHPTTPDDSDLVAPLGDFTQAAATQQNAEANEADRLAGPALRLVTANLTQAQAEDAAAHCSNEVAAHFLDTGSNATNRVTGGFKTAAQFVEAVDALQATAQAQVLSAGYRSCLKSRGFVAKSWLDLYGQVGARYHDMDVDWSKLKDTPGWASAVAYEQKAAAADIACRTSIRSWAIASLRKLADQYLKNPLVAKLAAAWQAIESDAKAAGLG